MVRQIKIVDVCSYEEADVDDDSDVIVEDTLPEVERIEPLKEVEARTSEVEVRQTKSKKKVLEMPTTNKIIEQVQCMSCGKSMSAKNLKYSHAKYCTERNAETQPEEIPVPQIEFKSTPSLKECKTLPVKRAKAKAKTATETLEYDTDEMQPRQRRDLPTKVEKPMKPETSTKLRLSQRADETPDQFWTNTVKNMKEKKMQQYKALCSNAFA